MHVLFKKNGKGFRNAGLVLLGGLVFSSSGITAYAHHRNAVTGGQKRTHRAAQSYSQVPSSTTLNLNPAPSHTAPTMLRRTVLVCVHAASLSAAQIPYSQAPKR
ncbi:MAG: hypothetical protein C4326_13885 [Ignavibacteria bacterium]